MLSAPLPRGVHVARWCGPNGETVLLPVTSRGFLLSDEPVCLAANADPFREVERWWTELDTRDPVAYSPRLQAM